jgi:hypothetical protein
VVQVKTQSLSLAVLLCFYVIFVFSINPFMTNFPGMSFEVTDQNNEGVFSSLSRNFEQTVEDINNADEKSTTSNVPIAAFDSSNLISSNSTTSGDLEKNNETGSIK